MSRILVVFHSRTGTCRQLAELLCAQQGWPRGEVVGRCARSGAGGSWRCALDTLLRRRPDIVYDGPDPAGYDAVVLVSPVWIYGLAAPMRSFVDQQRDALKRVAVLSVVGSAGASNAVAEVDRLLRRAPLVAAAFTARAVADGSCATRLQAFGKALQQAIGGDAATAGGTWWPRAA